MDLKKVVYYSEVGEKKYIVKLEYKNKNKKQQNKNATMCKERLHQILWSNL